MSCKHARIEGNTTKYWVCGIKNKAIDNYICRDCPLFIPDTNNNIKNSFSQIFGDDVVNEIFGGKK